MAFVAADTPPSSRDSTVSTARNSTERLAEVKAALESDPRPRYVVVKDGIDHGPFSAVELLQQIATGSFVGTQVLRDTLSTDERAIDDGSSSRRSRNRPASAKRRRRARCNSRAPWRARR